MAQRVFHLWEAFGVELEYMIVDAESLDVRPITDRVLYEVAGEYLTEFELGEISWSNELALHVIELKTSGPAADLEPLTSHFQDQVRRIDAILAPLGARLMPTAMHPWMDPFRELQLWPHEFNPIYETYNRIFDCRGHGWANLQSVHLNLPFADDEEFGRLHAAIRLLLPILPALAASSPVMDGQATGLADNRLEVYRYNSRQVRSVAGDVIPEPVFSQADYDREILQKMYAEIAPFDTEGVLSYEWLNSRGAIARFDRNTIEIRVLDVQECPAADLAVCAVIVGVLKALTEERWTSLREQQSFSVNQLSRLLVATIRDAELTTLDDPNYLMQFGLQAESISTGDLWKHLVDQVSGVIPRDEALETIL
ncbi:MAG TPA: glutamate-cysteine ligase family protein, partial [Planctomycetaceae bacterium]|nr:glutamate-cysteine ligase family protein [Planctomycetaceae bacterium]